MGHVQLNYSLHPIPKTHRRFATLTFHDLEVPLRKILVSLFALVCSGIALADAPSANNNNNPPLPTADTYRCSSQKHLVNLSVNDSGQTVEGPVCAQVTVNALKYAALLSKKYATPTAGQSLTSVLPTKFAPGGGGPRER